VTASHRRLLAAGRHAAGWLVGAVVLGLAGALLAIAQAWLLARAIAGAVEQGEGVPELAAPLTLLALVLATRAVLAWAGEVVAQRISGTVKARLRTGLLSKAVSLGTRWRPAQASGEWSCSRRGASTARRLLRPWLPQLALGVMLPVVWCCACSPWTRLRR